MRRWGISILVAFALSAGTACTVYPYREARVFADATGGEGAERAFWLAVQQKHWNAINTCLAPNFVFVTPTGRTERAAALQGLEKLNLDEASMGDITTEMNGNTFVVIYTLNLRGTRDGQPLPAIPQRRVSVWQRQKNSWVLIAHTLLANGVAPTPSS
jgi:ketosteroid isomerase-like protein